MADEPRSILRANNISFARQGLEIISQVSLNLNPQERLAVFGPNGAGKTTLLRLLAGLNEPTQGYVEYFVAEPPIIGFLGHESYLYDDLTGRENLRFFGELSQLKKTKTKKTDFNIKERIDYLAELADLKLVLDDKVNSYSRGMQQKLAICRCFLLDPDFLLLDEPFTGLDSNSQNFFLNLLTKYSDIPVIFTSHNIKLGYQLATRWLILSRGKIIATKENKQIDNFSQYYHQLTGQNTCYDDSKPDEVDISDEIN